MPEIETDRLRLRQYTLNDLDKLTQILSNPEVMKYSPRHTTRQGKTGNSGNFRVFYHSLEHGFGVWAVIYKQTNQLIGHCGLNFLPNSPEVEVLYRFEQSYWNYGIATEATKASLRYGFEEVKLDRIVAIAVPEHLASRRVMEKVGLKYERDAHFYNIDVVYYAVSREEWQPNDSLYILR